MPIVNEKSEAQSQMIMNDSWVKGRSEIKNTLKRVFQVKLPLPPFGPLFPIGLLTTSIPVSLSFLYLHLSFPHDLLFCHENAGSRFLENLGT
jgi:hypothetical protein